MTTLFSIRRAVQSDAKAISHLHISVWKTTYSGKISDAYLNKLDTTNAIHRHLTTIKDAKTLSFVAENASGILGMLYCGSRRNTELPFDGEIYSVYVATEQHRNGIGSALLHHAIAEMRRMGLSSYGTWVLESNFDARKFYESLGARSCGVRSRIKLGTEEYDEIAYGWK